MSTWSNSVQAMLGWCCEPAGFLFFIFYFYFKENNKFPSMCGTIQDKLQKKEAKKQESRTIERIRPIGKKNWKSKGNVIWKIATWLIFRQVFMIILLIWFPFRLTPSIEQIFGNLIPIPSICYEHFEMVFLGSFIYW